MWSMCRFSRGLNVFEFSRPRLVNETVCVYITSNQILPSVLEVSQCFLNVEPVYCVLTVSEIVVNLKNERLCNVRRVLIPRCRDLSIYDSRFSIRTTAIMDLCPKMNIVYLCIFLLSSFVQCLKKSECEVCVTVVEKFGNSLSPEVKSNPKLIEDEFRNFCKTSKAKENRFCYYLGGLEESATGILGELSKPLSWSMPAEKICEKLKKKDSQICDLHYDKTIDLQTVDLKKLKVRDLKKILSDWDETCEGCIEKSDFIKRIEDLKPQYMHQEL